MRKAVFNSGKKQKWGKIKMGVEIENWGWKFGVKIARKITKNKLKLQLNFKIIKKYQKKIYKFLYQPFLRGSLIYRCFVEIHANFDDCMFAVVCVCFVALRINYCCLNGVVFP